GVFSATGGRKCTEKSSNKKSLPALPGDAGELGCFPRPAAGNVRRNRQIKKACPLSHGKTDRQFLTLAISYW
ncbi:MAG: hypothetical protein SOV73_01340, partial [Candidatus Faecivivens sp.]|nr:hypothetical protein [Candidatus Faecivivens sp.]